MGLIYSAGKKLALVKPLGQIHLKPFSYVLKQFEHLLIKIRLNDRLGFRLGYHDYSAELKTV